MTRSSFARIAPLMRIDWLIETPYLLEHECFSRVTQDVFYQIDGGITRGG
jgi:hypothetical protein